MVETLSAKEVWTLLRKNESLQVLDIREREVYEAGHISGAQNLPLKNLQSRYDELDWQSNILLVCHQGNTSLPAARFLESVLDTDEHRIYSLDGGYQEWSYELEE